MLQGVGFRCYLPKSLSVRNMPEPLVGSSMQLKVVGLAWDLSQLPLLELWYIV